MTGISFEFFPPKSEAAGEKLWQSIGRLAPLAPDFVSVTYGAGGTTRDRTHACVKRIIDETDLKPAAHLTCVAAAKSEVDSVIDDYASAGVRHVVALRGDMPDMGAFQPHADGYTGSLELVAALAARGNFDITVSAYPEKHPESVSIDADIDLLKAKIDAGATRAITQFVFDTEAHLRFRDRLAAAGVTIPVIAGIMPTTNFTGAKRMAEACGANVPAWLADAYEGLEDDADTRKHIAASVAVDQCRKLIDEGFGHLHFYTLNQADLTFAVCRILKLGAAAS
ncbi:MAG: methylenetetrahydrofolate reductase [NAD(P)H] [PS1 clade bacterium]|uniref:Methylenetetrahydrofolate reductase n=1 Tax=PS1 clade bacterium TaxID=2175152 RepID=A0A937HCW0_9PROT|nr:methylenetetrahydrofolate reductase [NAD(P)H] [PS1 clade bacterium]